MLAKLLVDVQSWQAVGTIHHAEKLPTVPFVKANMVGNKVHGANTLFSQIFYYHIQQFAGNSVATVCVFGINCANVGCKIFAVVEVIFDHAQAPDNVTIAQTKIPSKFRFATKIRLHALDIRACWHAPLGTEPIGRLFHQLWHIAQCYVGVVWHSVLHCVPSQSPTVPALP